MKEGQLQIYHWEFLLKASAEELWPYLSDTNRLLKEVGATAVRETSFSRNVPKGFLELSHHQLKSYTTWQEEPYMWEAPFRYGLKRHYKLGILKRLNFKVECIPTKQGTKVTFQIRLIPAKRYFSFFIKGMTEYVIKRRLAKHLQHIEQSLTENLKPYELAKPKKLVHGAYRRLNHLKQQLIKASRRKRIVNRLIHLLTHGSDEELARIHPYSLAEYWGEKKYSVLNVFFHAAKLNILDFSWDVCCPTCKSPKHNFRKMKQARVHLYCEDCESDYTMDFNRNMHLVFMPHPLIRKISDKKYCLGGPGTKPHRVIQQKLDIGDTRYPQLKLDEGTYLFRTHNHSGHLVLHVRNDGTDVVSIQITDEELNGQEITISNEPNFVLKNLSSKQAVCFIDKLNWKKEAIYASEVSSAYDFRTLFAQEVLKETSKVKASEVTFLFTDLMNSTELYVQEGDESAIGRVVGHFNIIQQIVAEERGGIVKTIGDSVMAVFYEPVSALKAVQRIQQIFSNSSAVGGAFKLKAGVHLGDCTAVNLSGRIDYFGTTVNVASRLVDVAEEKEVMISEAVFNHPDVQLYLQKNSDAFFIKESMKELKGFTDEEFKVKQIRLERSPLRLVI